MPTVRPDLNIEALQAEVEGRTQKDISLLILKEVRATNGRVSTIERVVFGDHREGVDGLVTTTTHAKQTIDKAVTAVRVAKYLLPFIGLGQIVQVILMLKSAG